MVNRLINIIVLRRQSKRESFIKSLAIALREYADAIERSIEDFGGTSSDVPPVCGKRAIEEMKTSNVCEIRVIAGSYDVFSDHASKEIPLS